MPTGKLTPAQAKFFATYINKALLDRLATSPVLAQNAGAAKVIQGNNTAFDQTLRDIKIRFETVERIFRDIDDNTFAKGQKAPIEDFLALARTAINDLNGYNTDALVAAESLVDQAAVIVNAAQTATDTNARLTDALKKMGADIDNGCRKDSPLATIFSDHKIELAKLSAAWHTMLLPDATMAVADLRARITADMALAKATEARRTTAR